MQSKSIIVEGIALALIAAAAVLFWLGLQNEEAIAESWAKRERAYQLADELHQSSDDLTRMARTYAVTGDERYQRWFQEILDIRNGKAPRPTDYHLVYWDIVTGEGARPREEGQPRALRTLMEEAGFTASELALLERSEDESNALTNLENEAFESIRAGDREKAQELLHSDAYHQAKEAIMLPLLEFFREIDRRSAAELVDRVERQTGLNLAFAAVIVALFLLVGSRLALGTRNREADLPG